MTTPLRPPPHIEYPPQGWAANCKLTKWFIKLDPYPVILTPTQKVKTPSGGEKTIELPPRPEQIVRIINIDGSTDGINLTIDGQIRKFPMVIVGEWHSTIEIGDTWTRNGVIYRVDGLQPYNSYEVKGGVTVVGKLPSVVV